MSTEIIDFKTPSKVFDLEVRSRFCSFEFRPSRDSLNCISCMLSFKQIDLRELQNCEKDFENHWTMQVYIVGHI